MNVFDLFVVFLDAAQGAVEEPGLPEFALRTPALVDRAHRGKDADRKIGGPRYLLAPENRPMRVIPAKAEIHPFLATWTPAYAGVTR